MASSALIMVNQYLAGWKQWLTPRSTDRDEQFRERTIRGSIIVLAVVALGLAALAVSLGNLNRLYQPVIVLVFVALAVLFVRKGRMVMAGWTLVLLGICFTVATELQSGYWLPGTFVAGVVSLLLGAMLLPLHSAAKIPFILVILYAIAGLWARAHGAISPFPSSDPFSNPVSASFTFALIMFVLSGTGYYMLRELLSQRAELKRLIETLEERVDARTRDLGVAAEVSRQVTQVLDLEALLPQLTELTRKSFDLYHVSIFLHYESKQLLCLDAGTGEAGRQMMAANKQFNIADRGLVPLALRERKAQVINDVSCSADHQVNPFLPNTRSEVALPMLIGDKVIGVLDLQSEVINKFTADDIKVFTTLTEQIAVAVRNANLFTSAQQARQEAERSNRVKSQFLTSMSHELRTPLNAIINFSKFVTRGTFGPINDRQKEMLTTVVNSGEHLLNLINDVLDMSKIESGSMNLFIENDIDLGQICLSAVNSGRSLIGDKPVEIISDICPHLSPIVGDKQRLLQILLNIVSNACKFTQNGSITISAQPKGDDILVSIADTGPGIPREEWRLVFEPFKQTETGIRQGGGTGLGMPISKSLVESHGGRMWLESTPGNGTVFYVSLPVHSAILSVVKAL